MKNALSLLGFVLAWWGFLSDVWGGGLLSGGMDTTYRLTRNKSGGSVTTEFSQGSSYLGNVGGFIYDSRLLTFDINGTFFRDSANRDFSGQKTDDSSQHFTLGSSVNILPTSRFPLFLYFRRDRGESDSSNNDASELSLPQSQFNSQKYGFTLGMKEKGWYPQGFFRFDRDERWGDQREQEVLDHLKLNLGKQKEWKNNNLRLDYNFSRTSSQSADSNSSLSHSLNLTDYIRLSNSASLSLGSFLSRSEEEDSQTNTYGGEASFSQSFIPAFDPTIHANLGINLYYSHNDRHVKNDGSSRFTGISSTNSLNFFERRDDRNENKNFNAYTFASKRKEFSPKLALLGSLSGYISQSDQDRTSGESLSLDLTSRNIPYLMANLNYHLGLGQSQQSQGSLNNGFALNLSTYSWSRLRLNGGFNLSLSSGEDKYTQMGYQFGLEALLWRGLRWTSQVNVNNYEATRASREEREQGLRQPKEERLPSFLPRPFNTDTKSFSWNNTWTFQPLYWINTSFFYDVRRLEDKNIVKDPNQTRFRGKMMVYPPFLPRLSFSLELHQDEDRESGQTRSGWRGSAQFYRGKTTFSLDFNFDNSAISSRDNPGGDTSEEGIFFRVHRSVGRGLW